MKQGWTFDPAIARSHYKPIATNTYDLGTSSRSWRSAYLGDSLIFNSSAGIIRANSSDGSDNASLTFAGGGASGATRGAYLEMYGNEHANTGALSLAAGNVSGGDIIFQSGGSTRFRIKNNGQFVYYPSTLEFLAQTSDGADTQGVYFCGGGGSANTRGGYIALFGNEHGSTGKVEIVSGNVTGSKITIYTPGAYPIELSTNALLRWSVDSSGNFAQDATNGGDFTFGKTASVIRLSTSDGADNKELQLTGGGAVDATGSFARGAKLYLAGNEHATRPGEGYLEGVLIRVRGNSYVQLQSDYIAFRNNAGNETWKVDSSGIITQNATSGGDIVGNTTLFGIRMGTSNGADNKRIGIGGGGAIDPARGAYMYMHGNEFATNGGSLYLNTGDISGATLNYSVNSTDGQHRFYVNGGATERLQIKVDGVCLGGVADFGGGSGVVSIKNASANPSSNPSGGGVLYSDAGALKWRGSSGTITTIAIA